MYYYGGSYLDQVGLIKSDDWSALTLWLIV